MADAAGNRDNQQHKPNQPTAPEDTQFITNEPIVQSEQNQEREKYKPLKAEQNAKLDEFFQNIISKASLDFTNKELKDLEQAVYTMLERIRTRVNERGIFNIARIVKSGSMAEQSSLWKHDYVGKQFLEFDCLAVLGNIVDQCEDQSARNNCLGCITILNPPVQLEHLRQYYQEEDRYNADALKYKRRISELFLNEINFCLTLSCDCLSLDNGQFDLSFLSTSVDLKNGCRLCTVNMPTGTLKVNTESLIDKDFTGLARCSLVFLWTSKAQSLSTRDDWLLQEPKIITSLPIEVDFLPALESLRPDQADSDNQHDFFVLPKHCNVCETSVKDCKWRKSWCMDEINAFSVEMSEKHRNCYKVLKYLTGRMKTPFCSLSNYLVKTTFLNHQTSCSDKTASCVGCVLCVFQDLLQAYKSQHLPSYQSNINIMQSSSSGAIDEQELCRKIVQKLCSVSRTDSWWDFIYEDLNSD